MDSLVLYSLAIFSTAFIGGLIPLVQTPTVAKRIHLFVCLGAGLLLGLAFMHMLPHAAELIPRTFGYWFFAGFLLLLVLERFLMVHACEEHGCDYHTVGMAAFLGLTVHGVIEGFALSSSVTIAGLGPVVLIAILAHKVPQGVALTSILKMSGKKRNSIVGFIFGVALSGPLGIFAGKWLLNSSFSGTAGVLLALSSGTFVYIGACDLLPELHRNSAEKFGRLAAFFVGVVLSAITEFYLG